LSLESPFLTKRAFSFWGNEICWLSRAA
jgi:hypothetical protein